MPPVTLEDRACHDVNAHRTGVIRQADVHHEPSCMGNGLLNHDPAAVAWIRRGVTKAVRWASVGQAPPATGREPPLNRFGAGPKLVGRYERGSQP